MNFLPLLLFIGVGAAYLGAASKFQDALQYKVKTAKIDGTKSLQSNLQTIFLNVTETLTNPTNFSLNVTRISIDVLYHNTKVATITGNKSFSIPQKGSVDILLSAQIQTATLPSTAKTIWSDFTNGNIEIQMKGKIHFPLGSTDINETIKVI